MARPNYSYEKRQKELARQKKQEEKRLRKLEKRNGPADGEVIEGVEAVAEGEAVDAVDTIEGSDVTATSDEEE